MPTLTGKSQLERQSSRPISNSLGTGLFFLIEHLIAEFESTTTLTPPRRDRIFERVMRNVEIRDCGYKTPCWLWTGSDSGTGRGGGYPRMKLDGETAAVHIVMWTNEHGLIPGKKQLDHLCRQRACVRPSHCEMVTHLTNQRRKPRRPTK